MEAHKARDVALKDLSKLLEILFAVEDVCDEEDIVALDHIDTHPHPDKHENKHVKRLLGHHR